MKVGLREMLGDRRKVMGRNRTYLFAILCHLVSMPRPLLERGQTMVQLDLPQTSPPSKDEDAKVTGRLRLRMRTG